jgi:hypothetical protein
VKKKHFIFIIQNNNNNRKHFFFLKKKFLKKLKHEPSLKKRGDFKVTEGHGHPLVGNIMLTFIDRKLRDIKQTHNEFMGGLDVIMISDLYQTSLV